MMTMSNNKQQPKPENPNNQFSNTEPLTHAQRVAIANKMSNNLLHSTGTIVYDPFRGEMKRHTKWWCVLDVDREITRYYRWWLRRERHIHLEQPAWDAHISVVRGESACSRLPAIWKKYHKQKIDFTYQHGQIRSAPDKDQPGTFYWIDVECPMLGEIRRELNLPVGFRFHINTFNRV